MKLNLKFEEHQASTVLSGTVAEFVAAAAMDNLDAAKAHLESKLSEMWLIGRGGHHVWVSWKTQYEPIRVAMIVEAPMQIDIAHLNSSDCVLMCDRYEVDADNENAIREKLLDFVRFTTVAAGDKITINEVE